MEFIISFFKSTMDDPSNPFSILRILCESFKLLTKTKTLILPLLLLSSLSTSFLLLTNYLSTSPLLLNLSINLYLLGPTNSLNGPTTTFLLLSSSTHQLLTSLTLIQSIFTSISFILHSTLLIATTHLTTIAYLNHHPLTLEELLTRIKRGSHWKNPMITLLCFAVFVLGFILLLFFFFVVYAAKSSTSSVLCMVSSVALGIFSLYLVLYLAAISAMGLVASVVEEGCYGVEAVWRGMEMMNERGRKKQGIMISLVVVVVIILIYGGYYGFFKGFYPELVESPLVNGFVGVNVGGVMILVSVSAYTVLYFECKRSHFSNL